MLKLKYPRDSCQYGTAFLQDTSFFSNIISNKHSHFRPNPVQVLDINNLPQLPIAPNLSSINVEIKQPLEDVMDLLSMIKINVKVMSDDQLYRLNSINKLYCNVYDSDLSGGYNHSSGHFFADFQFSNKPPPT